MGWPSDVSATSFHCYDRFARQQTPHHNVHMAIMSWSLDPDTNTPSIPIWGNTIGWQAVHPVAAQVIHIHACGQRSLESLRIVIYYSCETCFWFCEWITAVPLYGRLVENLPDLWLLTARYLQQTGLWQTASAGCNSMYVYTHVTRLISKETLHRVGQI